MSLELADIMNVVNAEIPTLIVGDFNSLASFQAPQTVVRQGFTDSSAAVHDKPKLSPTWRWPKKPFPLQLRIDYIFHSAHFRTADSNVVCRGVSDHFLLVTELLVEK